jgi:iron complex outermembrane receptor protein
MIFKNTITMAILWIISFLSANASITINDPNKKITLQGKVTDKTTHETLPGATVFIPDLKTGTVTDQQGNFTIPNLPASTFMVQISFVGYQTLTQAVDLSKQREVNFELSNSPIEVSEVVVTGSAVASDIKRTSVSIATISSRDLRTIPTTNLANSLALVPGVSAITTGGAVSKPVIRGLGYNHVVTLVDGVRQEGNQWGDEHGLEIDQYAVDKVEILKGPASLLYGSDALGGVINILEPVPSHVGHIDSEITSDYSTNNGLSSSSVMNQGNVNGFVWKLRGTYKNASSFRTPTEYVYNSAFNEKDFSGMFGLNKSWGYSHIHLSSYEAQIGAIEGVRDSTTGKFVDFQGSIVPENLLNTRSLQVPFQRVSHQKLTWLNNIILRQKDELKINIGYQTNNRREFSESPDTPGLYFHLNTYTYDLKYQIAGSNGWEPAFGISGMAQLNRNRGTEYLIPDYNLQDFGGFVYLKKSLERLTFNGGLRYDTRSVAIHELTLANDPQPVFKGFNVNMSAFSGALGTTWNISRSLDMKLNLGRGYRAPNIAELSSNGLHEGTFRYEMGTSNLKPETSMQLDGELSFHTRLTAINFSIFYNTISNYIYQRNINGETMQVNGGEYPVYRYVQGNSLLTGFEIFADTHFGDNVHFENSFSYVYGENKETNSPLPFIPAAHSRHTLRWVFTGNKRLKNPYLSVGADFVMDQNRFDNFETKTGGYALFNVAIGTDIAFLNSKATLFVRGSNLTNRQYYDHLNRLKYVGIYNPGRDITVGFIVPLEWSLK